MAELKTRKNTASVEKFIDSVKDEQRRQDCRTVMKLMEDATGETPAMWGPSIVGFGSYHYRYATRREGDWFLTGFSPRKQNLTLYLMCGLDGREGMEKLGKFTTGKSCLYIKTLDDIHIPTLKKLIRDSVKQAKKLDAG